MSSNTIPSVSPRGPYLAWCTSHSATFTAHAAAIGLTPSRASAYDGLLKTALEAVDAMESQKSAYRASVVAAAEAMRALSKGNPNSTSEIVRSIRAFAESSSDPAAVFTLAEIDPPAPPSPVAAPSAPFDVNVGIDTTNGSIILRWKASQPASGTVYIVKRRVASTGPWLYVGTAGSDKTFVDATFAPGPDSVQYSITAQRSNLQSHATAVVVNFGTAGDGQFGVTGVKLAA